MSDTDSNVGGSIRLGDLKVGDWIRFYTNSLRGPGTTTHLVQVIGFKYGQADGRRDIPRKRFGLTAVIAIEKFDDVGEIVEVNPRSGRSEFAMKSADLHSLLDDKIKGLAETTDQALTGGRP